MTGRDIQVVRRIRGIPLLLGIAVLISACSNPYSMNESQDDGKMTVSIETSPRTANPDSSIQIALYRITFTHTGGEEVVIESGEAVVEISLTIFGVWDILVEGYNDESRLVASGTSTVDIQADQNKSVSVNLSLISGTGEALFGLNFNPLQVNSASVVGRLIDTENQSIPLNFSLVEAGIAESSITVDEGFYTLEAQLLDGETPVAGLAELVLVYTGGTTEEIFVFESVNKPGTPLSVSGDTFTVAWDPPSDPDTGIPLSVDGYRLYYREHGSYQWTFLAEIDAEMNEYTVTSSDLPFGEYDLAVSSVVLDTESDLHTSYDDTAEPSYGWYISWN